MDLSGYVSLTQNHSKTLHQPAFSYRTIEMPSTGSYREKGSKFLAFAYSVDTEDEIKAKLDLLKKEYFDARHYCYAWVLGADREKFRSNDDGEPRHSAGDPILGQIRSHDLTNTLIVVLRYFGGVKLGVGGLINAYRTATANALNSALIITKDVNSILTVDYDFGCTPDIMRLVKEFDMNILEQSFNEQGMMKVEVRLANKNKAIERLTLMQAMDLKVQFSVNE